MPTVPIIMLGVDTGTPGGYSAGWTLEYAGGAGGDSCQNIASGFFATPGGEGLAPSASIDLVSVPPDLDSGSPPGGVRFMRGNVTYTGNGGFLRATYCAGSGITAYYSTNLSAGQAIAPQPYSITLDGANFTLDLSWTSNEILLDAAPYYRWLYKMQVRIGGSGGSVYEPSVTVAPSTIVSLTGIEEYGGTTHDLTANQLACSASLTHALTTQSIELRLTNDFGEASEWYRLHLIPQADFDLSEDGGEVTTDAGSTLSLGDTIANYRFVGRDASTLASVFDITQAGDTLVRDVDGDLTGDSLAVTVTATTTYGCQDSEGPDEIEVSGGNIGTAQKPNGVLHTAVKSGDDVLIYRTGSTIAEKEAMTPIPGSKNPSLWRQDSDLFAAVTENGSGDYHIHRSRDDGRSWEQLT